MAINCWVQALSDLQIISAQGSADPWLELWEVCMCIMLRRIHPVQGKSQEEERQIKFESKANTKIARTKRKLRIRGHLEYSKFKKKC